MAPTSFESIKNVVIQDEGQQNFVAAVQIIQSCGLPMVLKATAELDVFGIMAKAGPNTHLSAKDIVDQLPQIQNPDAQSMLDRMLRLLATHSVVTCSVGPDSTGQVQRRYGLTPISNLFVADQNGLSLGPFLSLVEDSIVRAPWNKMKDALVDGGIPFNTIYGKQGFEYAGVDPRFNQVLNSAMFHYTTLIMNKMLETYKGFEGVKQLVDVGGNLGHVLHAITTKYPDITGINFDLPHVVCNAQLYPRVSHVGGSMFESVPSGDAIFMKGILHDWDDEHCLTLLKNCYKALPENGKIIAMDLVLSEEPETTVFAKAISQMDVYLMNIGGKERTEEEFLALANAAGFKSIKLVSPVCHYWMMEFYK